MKRKFKINILYFALVGFLSVSGCGDSPKGSSYKSYVNSKYHYSIDYPKDWKLEGRADSLCPNFYMIHFDKNKEKDITNVQIYPYPNPRRLSPADWYKTEAKTATDGMYPYPIPVASETPTSVNGYPAYKIVTNDPSGGFDLFIGQGTMIYRISFDKFNGDPALPRDVFDRMINSFRVTE